jgi:hypothetical protein
MDIEADLIPTKDNGGLDMDIDLSRPEATLLHERTVIARLSREDLEDRSVIYNIELECELGIVLLIRYPDNSAPQHWLRLARCRADFGNFLTVLVIITLMVALLYSTCDVVSGRFYPKYI